MDAKLMVGLTFLAVYVTLMLRRVKSLYWNHDSIRISHTFKSGCVTVKCFRDMKKANDQLTLMELVVHVVSTRKVSQITEELCSV